MKLDFFSSPLDGMVNRSAGGGFFTLLCLLVTSFLFLNELYQFAVVDTHEIMTLSPPHPTTPLPIRMHVTFPYLSCNDISVDYANTRSDETIEKKQRPLVKRRVAKWEQKLLKEANFLEASDAGSTAALGPPGCTIDGTVLTPHVGGNFKVTLTQNVWGSIALRGIGSVEKSMNVSHYIHQVGFGRYFDKRPNPLSSLPVGIEEGVGLVQFFLKIVPTKYKRPGRSAKTMYQTSMTEQFVKMSTLLVNGNLQQPGVSFSYDFLPMQIEHTESRENFFAFLASMFSVVGGVGVTVGLLSSCFMSAVGISKKMD